MHNLLSELHDLNLGVISSAKYHKHRSNSERLQIYHLDVKKVGTHEPVPALLVAIFKITIQNNHIYHVHLNTSVM
jgi:hypothetical protein